MRSILTLPDQRLRKNARVVESFDASLKDLFEEMEQLMMGGPGGVGIAAPQLGELVQAVIVDCSLGQRPCKNNGRLWMVNPEIITHSGEVLGREGCLSVPEWVAMVPRAKRIEVRYDDVFGESHSLITSTFEARVIQHELDHLKGILFVDRVVSTHDLVRRMG